MKLLGREISADALVARIEERLRARGITASMGPERDDHAEEPAVDPWRFYLQALENTVDAAAPLPASPDAPRIVQLARRALNTVLEPVARELLARQIEFNGHTRDSYAHLAAELKRLRAEVEALRAERVDFGSPAQTGTVARSPRNETPPRSSAPTPALATTKASRAATPPRPPARTAKPSKPKSSTRAGTTPARAEKQGSATPSEKRPKAKGPGPAAKQGKKASTTPVRNGGRMPPRGSRR